MVEDSVLIKLIEEKFYNPENQLTAKFKVIDKKFDAIDKKFDAIDKKFDILDEDYKSLKESFEKKTDELEYEIRDIKENHLSHIHEDINKINNNYTEMNTKIETNFRWMYGISIALFTMLAAVIIKLFI
ncbi:MAG: hypothetical protein LBB45_05855 [Methanobrevibacter sp.]|nr:hypothetical protein [Candidatus Methanovirga basalitermitum]